MNYLLTMNDLDKPEGDDDMFRFDAANDDEAKAILSDRYKVGDLPYTLTENGRTVCKVWP